MTRPRSSGRLKSKGPNPNLCRSSGHTPHPSPNPEPNSKSVYSLQSTVVLYTCARKSHVSATSQRGSLVDGVGIITLGCTHPHTLGTTQATLSRFIRTDCSTGVYAWQETMTDGRFGGHGCCACHRVGSTNYLVHYTRCDL